VFSNRRVNSAASQLEGYEIGDVVTGIVHSVRPYGAFVDIGGVSGLLHISQITNERLTSVEQLMQPGDKIKVSPDWTFGEGSHDLGVSGCLRVLSVGGQLGGWLPACLQREDCGQVAGTHVLALLVAGIGACPLCMMSWRCASRRPPCCILSVLLTTRLMAALPCLEPCRTRLLAPVLCAPRC